MEELDNPLFRIAFPLAIYLLVFLLIVIYLRATNWWPRCSSVIREAVRRSGLGRLGESIIWGFGWILVIPVINMAFHKIEISEQSYFKWTGSLFLLGILGGLLASLISVLLFKLYSRIKN